MKKNVLVALLLLLIGTGEALAGERINRFLLPILGSLVPSETLLDNTEHGATDFVGPKIPGWINSDSLAEKGFGIVFETGPSSYLIKNVTMKVGTLPNEAEFIGDVEVDLYKAAADKDLPEGEVIASKILKGQKIQSRPQNITIPVQGFFLEPMTRYAIVLRAPNKEMTRVMGFQVPDVMPVSNAGLNVKLSFWGSAKEGWLWILNPYIWVEGWNLQNSALNARVNRWVGGFGGFAILIGVIVWWRRKPAV